MSGRKYGRSYLFLQMRYLFIITTVILLACNNNNKNEPAKDMESNTDTSTGGAVVPQKEINGIDTQAVSLSISPLEVSGDLGQVTFTRNDSTIFYFKRKANKGAIRINQQEYVITRMSFVKLTNMYRFSGDGVRIDAKGVIFRENKGEDCTYGTIPEVTIRMGRSFVKLKGIDVQDCPAD
jgi:hypothetical protein